MKILTAPLGYILTKTIKYDDVQEIREFCLSLSDDQEYRKSVEIMTKKGLVKMLKDNGFEFEED